MHPTAAFLPMPNASGIVTGGTTTRGFNDGLVRGYPLMLTLSTRHVTDNVCSDEEILKTKGWSITGRSKHTMKDLAIALRQSDTSVQTTTWKTTQTRR